MSPLSDLIEVLREVRDLIDDYADITATGCPNQAMRAVHLIDEALRRVIGGTE
jgi:hypothetical protein